MRGRVNSESEAGAFMPREKSKILSITIFLILFILRTSIVQATDVVYCHVNYQNLNKFLEIGDCIVSFDEALVFCKVFLMTTGPQTFGDCTFENKGNRKFKLNGKIYEFNSHYFSILKQHIDNVIQIKIVYRYFCGIRELKGFTYRTIPCVVSNNQEKIQKKLLNKYFIPLPDGSCFLEVNSVTIHLSKNQMFALKKAMEDVQSGKRSYEYFNYAQITYPKRSVHNFYVRLRKEKDSNRTLIYFQSQYSKNPLPEEIEAMWLERNTPLLVFLDFPW
jgi:hypothetical protein